MLRRQGCDPAVWYGCPEDAEFAANTLIELEALGLLRPTERVAGKEAIPVTNAFVETDRTMTGAVSWSEIVAVAVRSAPA